MVYLCLTVYHGVLVSDCVFTAIIYNRQSSKDYIELFMVYLCLIGIVLV